ncbi:LPS assembly lipoprotein LptE [Candidatus Gullanella endobia]
MISTTGCGYRLCDTESQIPTKIKTIILNSYDPYGPLTRAVKAELILNNVKLVDNAKDKNNMPLSLYIIGSSKNKISASVFQDGKTAEYQMILSVYAQVLISGKDYYPINVKVYRSFLDNSLTALAKDSEEDIILKEMHYQAAKKLVHRLITMYVEKTVTSSLNLKVKQQLSTASDARVLIT